MASLIFNEGKKQILNGGIDLLNDTIKVALVTSDYIPNQATHDFFDDISNEISGTGYIAGGLTLTGVSLNVSNGVSYFDADDATWRNSTLTCHAAIIYKDTGASGTSPLVAYIDLGQDYFSLGEDLTIEWGSSGVFYYDADNPGTENLLAWWELNETSGNRADAHGSNTLVDHNGVLYQAGKQGNAADFESTSSQNFSVADNADLSMGNKNMTFFGFVKHESIGSANQALVSKYGNAAGQNEYVLYYAYTIPNYLWVTFDGENVITGVSPVTPPSAGIWYSLGVWHDADNDAVGLQIDDETPVTASTGGTAPGNTGEAFNMGAAVGGITFFFDGLMDIWSAWETVLTNAQRQWLRNSGGGRTYSEADEPITLYSVSVGLYDTRYKLRAGRRETSLTTRVRNT